MPNATDAMQLAAHGWRVHPLKRQDKRPILNAWHKAATTDEDVIAELWNQHQGANIGVAMGPDSGIISLDCDSPEAEEFLRKLFDGNEIVTPCFKTSRGKQYLFKYTGDLPNSDKANWKLKGLDLDFKIGNGKGSYCVFPPSIHPDGSIYTWLLHPDDVELAELPDQVVSRLHLYAVEGSIDETEKRSGHSQEFWRDLSSGVSEGGRNDAAAKLIGKLVGEMIDPTCKSEQKKVWEKVRAWNDLNKPPLPDTELRRTFVSISDRHTIQLGASKYTKKQTDSEIVEQKEIFGTWHLVRVDAKPPYYKLRSPLWDGDLELQDGDLLNDYKIRQAALSQKMKALESDFKKFWNGGRGQPGCYRYVVENHTVEKASFEDRSDYVLAGHIFDILSKAKDSEKVNSNGSPTRVGGKVWFRFEYLRSVDRMIADNERDVAKVIKPFSESKRVSINGRYSRFKVVSQDGLDSLQEMALYDTDEES